MALAFLERQLREELGRLGLLDLAEAAAGRVTFTDDGSTVYLHLFPREGWPHKHPGQAFVLAWADYEEICGLAGFRELVRLGRLAIRDNGEQIARWLERYHLFVTLNGVKGLGGGHPPPQILRPPLADSE